GLLGDFGGLGRLAARAAVRERLGRLGPVGPVGSVRSLGSVRSVRSVRTVGVACTLRALLAPSPIGDLTAPPAPAPRGRPQRPDSARGRRWAARPGIAGPGRHRPLRADGTRNLHHRPTGGPAVGAGSDPADPAGRGDRGRGGGRHGAAALRDGRGRARRGCGHQSRGVSAGGCSTYDECTGRCRQRHEDGCGVSEENVVLGGRYTLGRVLGQGGMAEVFLAEDVRLHRTVAVKVLRSDLARDSDFQERFRREAQSAAALNHPSIVAVYDTGEEHQTTITGADVTIPYIVMEYVRGDTLHEFIDPEDPMDAGQAGEIMGALLSALEYSHRAGIVHRDIKPGNVMINDAGHVKVMDFGIARAIADAASAMPPTQAVMGTAQYLSPEQARGQLVDARSDIYSAACVMYELLTGRPPFTGDTPVSIAYQHVREEPLAPSAYNPAITPAMDAVILTGLAKDRDR